MLIVWFFVYKNLAQFAVRCALPPRRSESPVCAADNKPSCVLHLLGWFIGSHGFSSLERRPEFWVLQVQFSSVTQSCKTLRDTMDCSMPGLPVHISVTVHLLWWAECLWPLWNGVFPAISINKDITAIRDSKREFLSLRASRKNNVCYLAAISHSPRLEMHMKGMISVKPDSCIFLYTEKR